MASPDYYFNTTPAVYAAVITPSNTYSTSRLYKGFYCTEQEDVAVYTKDGASAPVTLPVGAYQFIPLQIYGVLVTGSTGAGTVIGLYD